MSISWGKTNRIKFAGAFKLEGWAPPNIQAVYAITYKRDPDNRPNSHTVLYFGHGSDLAEQGLPWNHEDSSLWIDFAGGRAELYVFVHPMPAATQLERWRLHEQLVCEYSPACNRP